MVAEETEWKDVAHPTKFGKWERLCGETSTGRLFGGGKSFVRYPVRVVYMIRDVAQVSERERREAACRFLVSVRKKSFKRAVKRNRVKRQIREAWRKGKGGLAEELQACGKVMDVAFVFLGKELVESALIEKSVLEAIERLRFAVQSADVRAKE